MRRFTDYPGSYRIGALRHWQRLGGGLAGDVPAEDHSRPCEHQITNKQRLDPFGISDLFGILRPLRHFPCAAGDQIGKRCEPAG